MSPLRRLVAQETLGAQPAHQRKAQLLKIQLRRVQIPKPPLSYHLLPL